MANYLFGFGKKQEVKEATPVDKYIGVCQATLVSINPNKEELSKLLGREIDKDMVYKTKTQGKNINGEEVEVPQNQMSFWFKTNGAAGQPVLFLNYKVFLSKSCRVSTKEGIKVQIVDKWGRTAWCSKEEYDAKVIPMYKNGPAAISKSYRAAMVGEEDILNIIKCVNGLPNPIKGTYPNSVPMTDDELEMEADKYECSFEPELLVKIINGDVSILRKLLIGDGSNDVKLLIGIRHSDNADYQAVYDVYKKNKSSFDKIKDEVFNLTNSEFYCTDADGNKYIPTKGLIKYEVSPSSVTQNKGTEMEKPVDDMPF